MEEPPIHLELSRFAPHLSEPFTLRDAEGKSYSATLTEARSLASSDMPEAVRESFVLLFEADLEQGDPQQGTYEVSHPEAGTHFIFLVRVMIPGKMGRVNLEAVFN